MAYTRGTSTNIIVGAAAFFVADTTLTSGTLPAYVASESYRETIADDSDFTNVGYTMNGLELQFQPDFGEVQVDQLLDVAKLYKQGMQCFKQHSSVEGITKSRSRSLLPP